MTIKRDIEFLYELGCLRYMKRSWNRFNHMDIANVSEHILRVAWTALIIGKNEGIVNFDKLLKMALIHDLPESRTGDVDYISRQYTEGNEKLAIADIFNEVSAGDELIELFLEYKKKEVLEAKIIKDADNLDVDMELVEEKAKGRTLTDEWLGNRKALVQPKLYTETAKRMFDEIYAANPHNWHLNGRNRFQVNDWAK